ncbi:PREDICTED: histone deacetylase complex subunit SAP18 [Nicrophorus vespilloides]|uniref:18 kDa Sin3-associated polypeptide n=1 Tax=Nicrophorus vespilloides TaxID=110193 RepID=A0ABM1MDT3_NICVS|nr:PREDICTED: histone deacetylase complex subunit SAP18 [Nicrophorus vespilloides]
MSGLNNIEMVIEEKKEDGVDRQKVCPFLLRVFVSSNGHHHKISDYSKGTVPENELQIYTWRDATLSELAILVKKVSPEARRKGTKLTYALVYPDSRQPVYRLRDIGSTISGQKGPEDLKTLGQARFTIGDYMDISITPPEHWNNSPRKNFANSYNNHRQRQY